MGRMAMISALVGALAAGAAPAVSQGAVRYAAPDGLVVIGSSQEFEILTIAGRGKADYFCAAGRFARDRLGARNTDRVIVISGRTPSQIQPNRDAVVFAVTGPDGPRPPVARIAGPRRGQSASVGHANALCSLAHMGHGSSNDDD
ncbi:hypothetical protein [Tropicimonas sp. IMCC6043]|uniref:hypothetical protein n=1 Tax=Tropicimonas sp. IMCC6043 TaxID=2510645 RepID=UPI00101D9F9D|nr:hypothetical protein [Tropicimonas sp. IMCC6043]RYH08416.1 hypothetical protein EU800_16435 [Tropicimonas sp. IMCC6043]